jgi:hypothetical protein
LVVIQARGFIAKIALGGDMVLIAFDFKKLPTILPARLNIQTAINIAEDAG